jgi:hypothetical protein
MEPIQVELLTNKLDLIENKIRRLYNHSSNTP